MENTETPRTGRTFQQLENENKDLRAHLERMESLFRQVMEKEKSGPRKAADLGQKAPPDTQEQRGNAFRKMGTVQTMLRNITSMTNGENERVNIEKEEKGQEETIQEEYEEIATPSRSQLRRIGTHQTNLRILEPNVNVPGEAMDLERAIGQPQNVANIVHY